MKPTTQLLLSHPAHFFALGFGSGLFPKAPGTAGTLAALPIYFLALKAGGVAAVATSGLLLFVIGIWAAARTGKALGVADHGSIVIDEIAAFLLVLAVTPTGFVWVLSAFLLFRLFDIWKPWPINLADRKVKGGFGVMLDDLIAGVYVVVLIVTVRALVVQP